MFNFFGKKTSKDFMEEAKETYGVTEQRPMWTCPPEPESKPKEKEGTVYYRLGLTNNDRVSFQMGYSEITMNKTGCQQMIDQLTFFMNQLDEQHVEEASDSDDTGPTKD